MHKIVILPVIFYGYGTWSLILRKEHDREFLKTGCCEEYLDKREKKEL
jgi:hypothetical protein